MRISTVGCVRGSLRAPRSLREATRKERGGERSAGRRGLSLFFIESAADWKKAVERGGGRDLSVE